MPIGGWWCTGSAFLVEDDDPSSAPTQPSGHLSTSVPVKRISARHGGSDLCSRPSLVAGTCLRSAIYAGPGEDSRERLVIDPGRAGSGPRLRVPDRSDRRGADQRAASLRGRKEIDEQDMEHPGDRRCSSGRAGPEPER